MIYFGCFCWPRNAWKVAWGISNFPGKNHLEFCGLRSLREEQYHLLGGRLSQLHGEVEDVRSVGLVCCNASGCFQFTGFILHYGLNWLAKKHDIQLVFETWDFNLGRTTLICLKIPWAWDYQVVQPMTRCYGAGNELVKPLADVRTGTKRGVGLEGVKNRGCFDDLILVFYETGRFGLDLEHIILCAHLTKNESWSFFSITLWCADPFGSIKSTWNKLIWEWEIYSRICFTPPFTKPASLTLICQEFRTLQESISQQKAERQAETSTMQLSLNEVSLRLEQLQQAGGFWRVLARTWQVGGGKTSVTSCWFGKWNWESG